MCSNMGARAATPAAAPAAAVTITQPAPAAAPAPAQQAPQQPQAPAPVTYGRMPMSEAQYMAQQNFSAATRAAIVPYLQAHAAPGSLYSPSQILNNSLRRGLTLTAQQRQMMAGLDAGMHDLGYNANMTRYDRVGYVERLLGGRNYWQMTEQQVRNALIGRSYTDNAYVSASHNNFRNAPAGNNFEDKAVQIRIHAKAGTQALMPGNGPGGNFGEFILGRGQNFKIVDVKMPRGQTGRSGANYYQKIIITVEVG